MYIYKIIFFSFSKSYLRWLLEPVITEFGLEENTKDAPLRQLLREQLEEWACRLDHHTCLAMVDVLLHSILGNKSTSIL